MEKICLDILNKWAQYVNYDENQTEFNLLSFSYETNKTTKKFKHIIEDYDNTGLLAVLTAKRLFLKMLKESRVSLLTLIDNPSEFEAHKEMYNLFNSKEVQLAEANYIDSIKELVIQTVGKSLIGTFDNVEFNEKVFDYTDLVINELDKCKIDVYKKGGKIGNITKFSTKIHVFSSLATCVLSLNNAEDGMYLCYIDVKHSADSYFGFFIKSNGTLFSVHERINEAYKGQHANLRNGRWTEGKVDFFPYEFIFSFDDYDYKGYSHSYNIDEDKLSFFELTEDVYLPLIIAMIFLVRKFVDTTFDDIDECYIDSLLNINRELLNIDKNELMLITDNDIVKHTNSLSLEFDNEKILDGTARDEFALDSENHNIISSLNNGQLFVDLYGEGFIYKPILLSTQHLLDSTNKEYIPEFVGSAQRFRAQAYKEIRVQLADYIKQKMFEEYTNYGGITAVQNWFDKCLYDNIEKLQTIMVNHFVYVKQGGKQVEGGWKSIDPNIRYDITYVEDVKYLSYEYGRVKVLNSTSNKYEGYLDNKTGNICTLFFVIRPKDYKALESLFGEVPKIVKGWSTNGHYSSGNSLLRMTDAVEEVGTPFERYPSEQDEYKNDHTYMNFAFALGFSKRSFKALCKEKGVDMNLFKISKE